MSGAGSARFEHVFVLCTGRCGSLTFSHACQVSIDNYSAAHESRLATPGEDRLAFPHHHIEIDNRLIWFAGRLYERYGDEACYVHLTRDEDAVARSYARRRALGFLLHAWVRGVYVGLEDAPDFLALARDLVATVNANIRHFLRDKPHQQTVRLEQAAADFASLRDYLGASGDAAAATSAWSRRLNASLGSQTAAQVVPPADRAAVQGAFAPNAPLPEAVRESMQRIVQAPPGQAGDGDAHGAVAASATGRDADLERHFERIRGDFIGSPEVCFLVARHIVRLRRGMDLAESRDAFFALTGHSESGTFLAQRLSLRWLVSCLDTYADHAPLGPVAAGALSLSVLVNTLKLAETERLIVRDATHSPDAVAQLAQHFPTPLFGGLNAFRLESGDMVRNLFERLEVVLVDEPFLAAALLRIRRQLRETPNLFSRLGRYHPALF